MYWNWRSGQRSDLVTGASIGPETYPWTPKQQHMDISAEYFVRKNLSIYASLRNITDVLEDLEVYGPLTLMHHDSSQHPQLAAGPWRLDRRGFLKASSASLFGLALGGCGTPSPSHVRAPFRFGLLTDTHYADAKPNGKRFYRESLPKTQEAVQRLRDERVSFLGMLGDLKDMAPGETEESTFSNLVAIEREIQRFGGPTYHVLGNHDMDNLPKSRVLAHIVNTGIAKDRSYYAFSHGGVRFIALDATYDQDYRDYDRGKFDWRDANVPPPEITWLQTELGAAKEPIIIFVHQRLDGDGATSIRNRAAVRQLLEVSGKVLAVFQGHDHPGDSTVINGIHYYTLRAVIEGSGAENNAYAVVDVLPSLDITVTGYRRAVSAQFARNAIKKA